MIGVCTDDGESVGSPELRLLRRNLLPVASGVGARASPSEIKGQKGAGHHPPNHREMETWIEDRAKTSQPAGHCRVEEQALMEQGAEEGG